jgi:hypothetical protein
VLAAVSFVSRKPVAHQNGVAAVAGCPSSGRSRPAASRLVQPLPEAAPCPVGECRPPSGVGEVPGCSGRWACARATAPASAGVARDLAVVTGGVCRVLVALLVSLGIVSRSAGRFAESAGAF